MKKKYLVIAMSALFLLTCTTSCGNGKSDAGKDNALVQNPEDDALIRDFIINMYENKLYNDYDFLEEHCTTRMLQYLKDEYEYDGDGYAGYLFRTGAQDIKPGAEGVKDKVLSITRDSDGWYHYTFTDGGWHGENIMKVRVENGKVLVDELDRLYDELAGECYQ